MVMAKRRNPQTVVIFTILRILAPIIWMAFIFYLSSEGRADSSGRSSPLAEWLDLPEWFIRKAAHFALYLILGLLVYGATRAARLFLKDAPQSRRGLASDPVTAGVTKRASKETCLAALICILYAVFDEWHQSWNPERSAQVSDVILDSAASIIGIFVLYYIYEKITHRRAHRLDKRRQI